MLKSCSQSEYKEFTWQTERDMIYWISWLPRANSESGERNGILKIEQWTTKKPLKFRVSSAWKRWVKRRVLRGQGKDIKTKKRVSWRNWTGYDLKQKCYKYKLTKEFDPGSGRTLAARLTHASRTSRESLLSKRVADGWVTREQPAFKRGITFGNER